MFSCQKVLYSFVSRVNKTQHGSFDPYAIRYRNDDMMPELVRTPTHTTREALDLELNRAGFNLSPFPFERTFDSFGNDPNVILYRCISGDFNPRIENKDWSLNPLHALEYANPVFGSVNTLLLIQLSKVELSQVTNFYSGQGNKIGLTQSPDPERIAKTSLTRGSPLANSDLLRCMRHVIRFGVDPENSTERRFSADFKPEDLQFSPSLAEWQLAVGLAYTRDGQIPLIKLPEAVKNDYNSRRGGRVFIE